MRFATVRQPQGPDVVVRLASDGTLSAMAAPDIATLLSGGLDDATTNDEVTATLPVVDELDFAPLVQPAKAIFVGLNYRDHILEMGRDLPDHPTLFTKFTDALVGANDPVRLRPTSQAWDHEVELGVVIGQHVARDVDRDQAVAAIAGYTVVNDMTARDWQKRTGQFLQGKTWQATTPVGPWLVPAAELDPDSTGHPGVEVTLTVNGQRRQHGNTSELVFDPATLVSYVSNITSLAPGDLIATGTPGGVAAAMDPPGWLQPGDVIEATVAGIGTCRTECR